MELKLKINSIDEQFSVNKVKKVNTGTFNESEYLKMFNQLIDLKIVKGDFNATHWKVFDKIQDMYVEYSFDIEVYLELNKCVKFYSILSLLSNKKTMTVYNAIQYIKHAILNSDGLTNTEKLESYLQNEFLKSEYQVGRISRHLLSFLSFIELENTEEIKSICHKYPNIKQENRDLPNFQSVLKFDDIINDYFRKGNNEVIFEYLPIMMWWLLTNVLPLRPSEFLMLEKNCLLVTTRYNKPVYSIKITRIKENEKDEYIEIDEQTYNILYNAIFEIDRTLTNNTPYLFTTDLYYYNQKRKIERKKSNKRMNRRDFYAILNRFYENVVIGIYKENELEKIRFGDTRHFAIINMCLQGFNMLSIARMAGHKDIYTQDNYFSHASHFAQSYVYSLAQKKLEHSVRNNLSNGIIGWKRYVYDKGKAILIENFEQDKIVGRIKHGYCTEGKDVFPSNCIEDCRLCERFLFNPAVSEYDEAVNWLSDCSKILETKISETIELMHDLASRGNGNTYNNYSSNNLLITSSRKLTSLMDMKATLDAKIMEEKINEQEAK